MAKREKILFSCIGTTDPVRGHRDGGLVHIVRHCRPKAVCLFVSQEMERKSLPYCEKMFAFMEEKWGYRPEVVKVLSGITDPSDLDALDRPMREAFEAFHRQYPEADILVNLSSGTPQMEILLSQLVLSPRYRVTGIQVKNPERQAGTADRTVHKNYNPEEEIANNRDEEPGAENRCVRPNLFAIRRERERREVMALLDRRDYAAIVSRKDSLLPADLLTVVRHLYERDLLHGETARELAERLPAELNLYPGPAADECGNYWAVVDYWLMMKNLLRADKYSDFVLRLSVLALFLEEELLKTLMAERGVVYEELLIYPVWQKDGVMSMERLEERLPDVYGTLCGALEKAGKGLPADGRSVFLYSRLLRVLNAPGKLMKFFNLCDMNMTGLRNNIAHRLDTVTAADFSKAANMTADTFLRQAEQAVRAVYPRCDPAVFEVHERCAKYMETHWREGDE